MDTPHQLTFPSVRLGAESTGRLSLPDSQPTPSYLSMPRGVFMTDRLLVVADIGNHRVMIWHGLPTQHGQAADVVLGQPDFYSQRSAGCGVENGFHTPGAVLVVDGVLLVADAWHHRILGWNRVPERSGQPPDFALGQTDLQSVQVNRGASVSALSLYWPYGIAYIAGYFYIADTGNRRVLGWKGLPAPEQPPDFILGQDSATDGLENRGRGTNHDTFRWPYALAGNQDVLYVADSGNHRVLGWSPRPDQDRPADLVLGQKDFTLWQEFPYRPQGAAALRFPSAVAVENDTLAVADMSNNRILLWHRLPKSGGFQAADAVLGQLNFDQNGENRWDALKLDTLCWPYGVHLHEGRLAIADSGNNRVLIWQIGK